MFLRFLYCSPPLFRWGPFTCFHMLENLLFCQPERNFESGKLAMKLHKPYLSTIFALKQMMKIFGSEKCFPVEFRMWCNLQCNIGSLCWFFNETEESYATPSFWISCNLMFSSQHLCFEHIQYFQEVFSPHKLTFSLFLFLFHVHTYHKIS